MDDGVFEELRRCGTDRPARLLMARWQRDGAALLLLLLVARHSGVPVSGLLGQSRGRSRVAGARQLAMYLTSVLLDRTQTDVGRLYGRDRTTVTHACRVIEDRRDDPAFEAEVAALERRFALEAGRAPAAAGEARHALA
jgi:hypothetical protein